MRVLPLVALALLLPALAGCTAKPQAPPQALPIEEPEPEVALPVENLTVAPPPLPPPPPEVFPRLAVAEHVARGTDALFVPGPALAARPDGDAAPCDLVNCARHAFEVAFGPGYWERHDGFLEVSIVWGGFEGVDFLLQVLDRRGEVLAEDGGGEYAKVVLLEEPEDGTYTALVKATELGGAYTLAVQVEPADAEEGEPRDLLPNLVPLAPKDLSLTSNNYFLNELGPVKWEAYGAAGIANCGLDEMVEAQARKCLRFATAVGNIGEGALEVHLSPPNDLPALVGEGQFLQRVYRSDGSFHDEPVGKAAYHPTHRHLHYQGLAQFTLYRYDLDGRTRGEEVGVGHKAGFCMVNEGLVEQGMPGTVQTDYGGLNCDFLDLGGERLMRISRGWFDMYEVNRPDQYVEVTGLGDGEYELVVRANSDGSTLETTTDDNESGAVFRLAGASIEVLFTHGRPGPFGTPA